MSSLIPGSTSRAASNPCARPSQWLCPWEKLAHGLKDPFSGHGSPRCDMGYVVVSLQSKDTMHLQWTWRPGCQLSLELLRGLVMWVQET